jgi:DNA-binding FadR family transcriptional regulator
MVTTMTASTTPHSVFVTAIDDHPEVMHQALQVAYLFERHLLQTPDAQHRPIPVQSMLERYDVSRGVGHEAIRILQHRKIIEAKRGPNGGLRVIVQSDANLMHSVARFLQQSNFSPAHCAQARESLRYVTSSLPPGNPAIDLLTLMLELLKQLDSGYEAKPASWQASAGDPRADQIARAIVRSAASSTDGSHMLRIGHESELCEQFHVSKPVLRQAIRILEAQSLVETRRGRRGGLYFASPQPGPVSRLLAFWLLGRKVTFPQVFELEHPLRVAVAMLAVRGNTTGADGRQLLKLQERIESSKRVQLADIINMEKRVSWLADNALLDLLLRSMTVYKICRARYRETVEDHSQEYALLNREFLLGLSSRKEAALEHYCQQKNHFLMTKDLDCMQAS